MKSMKIIQKLLPLPSCSSVFDQSAKKLTNGMKLYEGLKQGKLVLPEDEFMVNVEKLGIYKRFPFFIIL